MSGSVRGAKEQSFVPTRPQSDLPLTAVSTAPSWVGRGDRACRVLALILITLRRYRGELAIGRTSRAPRTYIRATVMVAP